MDIYISDLIEAYDFIAHNGIINIISILKLLELLKEEIIMVSKYEFKDWRRDDQKVNILDIRKANKHLDWHSKFNPNLGIKLLFFWIKNNINLF